MYTNPDLRVRVLVLEPKNFVPNPQPPDRMCITFGFRDRGLDPWMSMAMSNERVTYHKRAVDRPLSGQRAARVFSNSSIAAHERTRIQLCVVWINDKIADRDDVLTQDAAYWKSAAAVDVLDVPNHDQYY